MRVPLGEMSTTEKAQCYMTASVLAKTCIECVPLSAVMAPTNADPKDKTTGQIWPDFTGALGQARQMEVLPVPKTSDSQPGVHVPEGVHGHIARAT